MSAKLIGAKTVGMVGGGTLCQARRGRKLVARKTQLVAEEQEGGGEGPLEGEGGVGSGEVKPSGSTQG